jgi:hypothetical protein
MSVAALAFAISACSSNSTSAVPAGGSLPPQTQTGSTTYTLLQDTTSIGAKFPLSPASTSWVDISNIDGPPLCAGCSGTGNYIVADKANAGVTMISTSNLAYVRTAGAGQFIGVGTTVNGQREGGPNGIVVAGSSIVYAGDGNSNVQVVNVATGQVLTPTTGCSATVLTTGSNLPGPGSAGPGATVGGQTICGIYTGGQYRADEGAYDPVDNLVMIGNDEEQIPSTPFETILSNANPASPTITGKVTMNPNNGCAGANCGLEQPTWDASQKLFVVSVPGSQANPNGEVDVINPRTAAITSVFTLPGTNCAPAGSALNPANDALLLGCGNTNGLVIINATTGAVLANVTPGGGCDEVWYNPTDNRFYAACSNFTTNGALTPKLFVVDGTAFTLLAQITTSSSAHSVAVDPVTNRVFVPVVGGTASATVVPFSGGAGVAVFFHT